MIGKRSVDDKPKIHRNPVLMLLAGIIFLIGLALTVFGGMYFHELGWIFAMGAILTGFSAMAAASMTMITGDPEYIITASYRSIARAI